MGQGTTRGDGPGAGPDFELTGAGDGAVVGDVGARGEDEVGGKIEVARGGGRQVGAEADTGGARHDAGGVDGERVADREAGVGGDGGDDGAGRDARTRDDLADGEAAGVGRGDDVLAREAAGGRGRARGEDRGDGRADGHARAQDGLADRQAGHVGEGDAARAAGAADDRLRRFEADDGRAVGGEGGHLQPAGRDGGRAGVGRLAGDRAGREDEVTRPALDEAAGADDRRRERPLGGVGDGIIGTVDGDGEHARGGRLEILDVGKRREGGAAVPDEVEGAAGDLDDAGEAGARAAEIQVLVADLDERAGADELAVEGAGRRERERTRGGRGDVAADVRPDGDAAEVQRGQFGHRHAAGVEPVELGRAEREGGDVDRTRPEDGIGIVQGRADQRGAEEDARPAGEGAAGVGGERLAEGEGAAVDGGDDRIGGEAGAGDELADGEAGGVGRGQDGKARGDDARHAGGGAGDDLGDVGVRRQGGAHGADALADGDPGDAAERERRGADLARGAEGLDRRRGIGEEGIELGRGAEVVGEQRVGAGQLGREQRRAGGRVADGQVAGAEVEHRTGGAEEGADDLGSVHVVVGAAAHQHEGRGVGGGVRGAGDQGAARTDDGGAVVGGLEEVRAGGAGQREAGGALLDEAADAGDRAAVRQDRVLLQRDVAAAELDLGGIVAGEVADELVRVAEGELGLAAGGRVEGDRGGVDEGVVPAAREGKVDAVVDQDVAEELVLTVDHVDFARVEAGVDLDAGAAAVVDHRRGEELEGRARGARQVGREGARVVLQDGEGAAVADQDLLLTEALDVGDEGAALDLGEVVGGTAGEQEDEGARAGLDDAAARDVVDRVEAEDVAAVVAVAARLLVDGEGVAVEPQGAPDAGAGDHELALVVHVGGGAHGVHGGVDLARIAGADVRRALGPEGEVGLEIADRLVVAEDDLGARAGVRDELAGAVALDGQGPGVREERGAVVPAEVVVRIGGDLRVADVRAAAGKAERSFRLLGAVEVGGVLRAGDVEGTAVGEGEAGGRLQDDRAARGDEVARHPRVVEDAEGAGARLDDLAAPGEGADGADEVLVDVDAEAVGRVGAGGDGGLELVVVVAGLEVAGEVEAQLADLRGGVGEAEFGRAVEHDAAHAGHALGQGVGDAVAVAGVGGDVGDEGGDFDRGEDLALHAGAVVVPHVEVAADHEQAGVDLDAALQAGEAPVVRRGRHRADDGRHEVDGPGTVDVVRAGVGEGVAERRLDVGIRQGDVVVGVAEHAAGAALVLQHAATRLEQVAVAAEGAGDRRGDQILEDGDRPRVGDGDAVGRGGVAQDDEGLRVRGERRRGGRERDGPELQGAVRGGEVRGHRGRAGQVDVREVGGRGLGGHRGVERAGQQAVAAREEAQRLGLARDIAGIVEDIDGLRRVDAIGVAAEHRADVIEGQRGGVGQAGTRDQRESGHGGRPPVVVGRRAGPTIPGTRATQGRSLPSRARDVLLGLGEACGGKHSGGHQQSFRDPHGVVGRGVKWSVGYPI